MASSIFAYSALRGGVLEPLATYRGGVTLITNTASQCSFSIVNMAQLIEVQRELGGRGLTVLAFPCAQFAGQEPKSNAEICKWASDVHHVNFPVYDKVKVRGPAAEPLFAMLQQVVGPIRWNYHKILCNREGVPVLQLDHTTPTRVLIDSIVKLL